jgi:hypothetical protein
MLYCMVHNIEKIMNCAMAWWGWIVDDEDNMLKVKSWDKNIDTRYLKNVRLQKFEFWRVRWIFKNDFSDNLSGKLKYLRTKKVATNIYSFWMHQKMLIY